MKNSTNLKFCCFNRNSTVRFFVLAVALFLSVFSHAANYYWVGGSGNWSDFAHHWATSSGGHSFAPGVPGTGDNVYFDSNSFGTPGDTITLNVAGTCNNMDWTGVTNKPKMMGANQLSIYGSLKLVKGMSMYCTLISFLSNNKGNTLNFTCDSLSAGSYIFNGSGDWTLKSNLIFSPTMGSISIENGTLNTGKDTLTLSNLSGFVVTGNCSSEP